MKKNSAYEDLVALFARTTDQQQMLKLFEEIFTPAERKDLALRWNLMQELYKGTAQRTIAKEFHISLCKITRGSKILKEKDSFCRKVLAERFDDDLHL
ncbi:MAG: Trp family transcriptional regulator [Sphaerochaetaceae bacterium]|nr:Trp family transcriptional regulator [Spirochaetales bacterium]MDY5500296.1 Trp family transcriptional regulator [Sphaerochaetaceae bacterium]